MPYRDPTVGFTVLVMSAPPLMHAFEHGVVEGARAAIQYLTSPTMIMSYLFLLAVVTVAHAGPTVKLGKRDRAVAFWFLMNGVYYNLFLDVVSGQFQMNDLMTFQYNKVEPRYQVGPMVPSGQSVFWTSMCEIFFQSPFCLLTYYAYVRGLAWRRPLEIVVGCLHIAGVWWFYVPEAYAGFPHLGGWPKAGEHFSFDRLFYFYFGFWFSEFPRFQLVCAAGLIKTNVTITVGALWTSVAFLIARTSFMEITAIIDAHDHKPKVVRKNL